jgi:deoxycytidylate deaminase
MVINMRPTWDEHFIKITEDIANRSTCSRLSIGARIQLWLFDKE